MGLCYKRRNNKRKQKRLQERKNSATEKTKKQLNDANKRIGFGKA